MGTPAKAEITSSGIPNDKPIAVFYFDPNCDQCQKQAVRFKEKAAKLTNITIVFVAWAEIEEIEKFRKEYFSTMLNTIFCRDEEY